MLLQKQKIKIFTIFKKPFAIASLAAVFISLVSAFFFNPSSIEAQTTRVNYKPEDVKFEISVNDNFFRTYDGGNVQFVATVKLVTPDQLVTGALVNDSDCITIGDSACTANKVDGVSIGVINKTQNSTACGPGQQGAFSCNFIKMAQTQTPSIIKKGEPITFNFSLSSAELKSLQVASSNEGVISEIYVYPFLQMSRFRLSFSGGAKSVFIQSYTTQAQYDANKNNARPEGIPENGSVTSSPTIKKTGDPLLGLINNLINIIVGMAQQFIYWVFYLLIAPLIQAMLSIQTYTDTFAAVIYPGWEVVRNACNILFIVALIAIGLGTLFRVESYQYKHLLVDLIIAALLVNFSLVIAQVILGVADTVQSQFLPNNLEVIRSLAKDLMAGFKTVDFSHIADAGYFSTTLQPLFSLGLSIGSFIVFASIAGFLLVRIIMLWVLLMLSPLAYAMRILPQTKSYTGMWWSQFIKYAFFTPVMAFFLNMAAVINNNYNSQLNNKTGIFQQIIDDPSILGNSDIAAFVFRVGGNIIILVFLFVAIKVAEGAGVYGADAVAKAAKGGIMAPFAGAAWLGQRGVGRLNRWYNEKTSHLLEQHGDHPVSWRKKAALALLNPKAVAKGWQKRSEELAHHAEEEAEAAGRMVAEQFLTRGKLQIPYNQFLARKHENDYLKDYGEMKKESLMAAAVALKDMKGAEGSMRKRAIIKAMAKNGYLDDALRMREFAQKYMNDDGSIYNAEVLNRFLIDYLGDTEQTYRFLAEDMEDLGMKTKHYEYLGHAYFDNKDKVWKRGMTETGEKTKQGFARLRNDWQAKYASGEYAKVGGRERAGLAPHNLTTLIAKVDKDGNLIGEDGELLDPSVKELDDTVSIGIGSGVPDEYQRAIFGKIDSSTISNIAGFAQSRLKEWLLSMDVDSKTGEVIVRSEEDLNKIRALYKENPEFMKAVYGALTGLDPRTGVKGLKISMLDKSGKKTSINEFGEAKLNAVPIADIVAAEVMSGIKVKSKAKESVTGLVKGYVAKLATGKIDMQFIKDNLRTELNSIDDVGDDAVKDKLAADLIPKIKPDIAKQFIQAYNPKKIVADIDKKIYAASGDAREGLSASQFSDLSRAIQLAAEEAFNNLGDSQKFTKAEAEAIVLEKLEKKINKSIYEKLETDDLKTIAAHILPAE